MGSVRVQVVIDCADPGRLAGFWSAALQYSVQFEDPTNAFGAVEDPDDHGPRIVFQRVPEPKLGKSWTHLDLQVGQDILGGERDRLTELGAVALRNLVRLDPGVQALQDSDDLDALAPVVWRRLILADPEGNEFCLQ